MHFLTVTALCEFKLKPCQASCLQNRKQAVSAFFTCILDGTQIKPVHSITSCVATHKNQRPLNTYKFYHLDGTFQPTLHQLVLAQLRCQQRQIAPLHPTATQLHWHQHSSQQALPHAYLDLLISNNNIKSTSNKPTAIERATPVERKGLFPWVTGHGSLCSSPSRSVKFMSILCTGCRNLQKFKYNVFLLLSSEKEKSAFLFLAHVNCTETVIRSRDMQQVAFLHPNFPR